MPKPDCHSTSATSVFEVRRTCGHQGHRGLQPEIRPRPPRPRAGRADVVCNPLKTLTSARPPRPPPKGGTPPPDVPLLQGRARAEIEFCPAGKSWAGGRQHKSGGVCPNRSILILTGNNITLSGDLPRRVLTCRSDPTQVERGSGFELRTSDARPGGGYPPPPSGSRFAFAHKVVAAPVF